MVDAQGRPYFLWDLDWTLDHFLEQLRTATGATRAWLMGKLLREAKPDDVFQFVTLREITEIWPAVQGHLGRRREFWTWLLTEWGALRAS